MSSDIDNDLEYQEFLEWKASRARSEGADTDAQIESGVSTADISRSESSVHVDSEQQSSIDLDASGYLKKHARKKGEKLTSPSKEFHVCDNLIL